MLIKPFYVLVKTPMPHHHKNIKTRMRQTLQYVIDHRWKLHLCFIWAASHSLSLFVAVHSLSLFAVVLGVFNLEEYFSVDGSLDGSDTQGLVMMPDGSQFSFTNSLDRYKSPTLRNLYGKPYL